MQIPADENCPFNLIEYFPMHYLQQRYSVLRLTFLIRIALNLLIFDFGFWILDFGFLSKAPNAECDRRPENEKRKMTNEKRN